MFTDFNTKIVLTIDWGDIDLFGHVNNVSISKYIQAARVNYVETIGLSATNEKDKLSFIMASTNCLYKRPLHYPGKVTIYTKVDWIKNSSLQLTHVLINEQQCVVAESQDVLVIFDYINNTKSPITDVLKANIESIEKNKF